VSTKFGIEAHDVKAPAPKHNITIWHFRRRYRRVPAISLHTTVGYHPEAAAARRCKDKQAESRSGSIATEAVRVCIHALRSVPKADANKALALSRRANRRIETGHPVETSRASAGDRIASPRLTESGLRSNTMRSLSRTTARLAVVLNRNGRKACTAQARPAPSSGKLNDSAAVQCCPYVSPTERGCSRNQRRIMATDDIVGDLKTIALSEGKAVRFENEFQYCGDLRKWLPQTPSTSRF
jgi:hypothetical protein